MGVLTPSRTRDETKQMSILFNSEQNDVMFSFPPEISGQSRLTSSVLDQICSTLETMYGA